jgi:hypothetical protein
MWTLVGISMWVASGLFLIFVMCKWRLQVLSERQEVIDGWDENTLPLLLQIQIPSIEERHIEDRWDEDPLSAWVIPESVEVEAPSLGVFEDTWKWMVDSGALVGEGADFNWDAERERGWLVPA